jgi:hypothetical protein
MYAALRAIPIPNDVVARLFHAALLLREHRGDGHIAALTIEGVGGLEAHVLFALDMGMPAERFGRIHHLPAAQLGAVIDGMRDRGLIGDDGWLSNTVAPSNSGSRRSPTIWRQSPTKALNRASSTSSWPPSSRSRRCYPPPRTGRRSSDDSVRDIRKNFDEDPRSGSQATSVRCVEQRTRGTQERVPVRFPEWLLTMRLLTWACSQIGRCTYAGRSYRNSVGG